MIPPSASVTTPPPERDPVTSPYPGTRPAPQRRPGPPGGSTWRVPAALVVLSIVPLVAGSLRLLEVAGGPQLLPDNPRIDAVPAPVVLHIVAAALYALLGALAVGAGTQVFTQGIGEALFGTSDLSTALSISAGWIINAAVAEWVIRRPGVSRARRARARTALAGSR
jgi:hypothetical protein